MEASSGQVLRADGSAATPGGGVVVAARQLSTAKAVRTVLDEDEYLGKIDEIIQRDFFHDIPQLRAQKEYLEAVDRNDVVKIRELQLRFSSRRTDRAPSPTRRSPKSFDTPSTSGAEAADVKEPPTSAESAPEERRDRPRGAEGRTLDGFLGKYTSEDNASFEELVALSDARERVKHGWMYQAELKHNRDCVRQGVAALPGADEQLALPAPERPNMLDNWSYEARNSVLFYPKDAQWTEEEAVARHKLTLRQIKRENTRFVAPPFREESGKESLSRASVLQAAMNRGKVDVLGQEAAGARLATGAFGVLATPSPAPGNGTFPSASSQSQGAGVNESPMMTWGEIEGTPFRLDASDLPAPNTGPVFKMPEVPLRDRLAQSMNDELARRYRNKRKKAVDQAIGHHSKTPRFGSVRSNASLNSMSPAARHLATTKLGIRIGSDKALKASYTPSPARSRTQTPTPAKPSEGTDASVGRTPADGSASVSLTDNLLHLKSQRPSASDFF